MLKVNFECRIVAQDEDIGFWRRRVITGRDIYNFTVAFATAMFEVTADHAQYGKTHEHDEMEKNGELPF
jgi:hypothetical protein